ncbi:hypothetical protein CDAR_25751 [Caerostris darwini]|uniref:NADH dehydrogenase subunit 4 n=1 Tax=Caerostris darwini TaxID=1538125 RepID=A0AAV4NJP5_9ARAC|nr:hypothetical protein CDAR_25751 [Caerostris darwini]
MDYLRLISLSDGESFTAASPALGFPSFVLPSMGLLEMGSSTLSVPRILSLAFFALLLPILAPMDYLRLISLSDGESFTAASPALGFPSFVLPSRDCLKWGGEEDVRQPFRG